MAISEPRLIKRKLPPTYVILTNYNYEFCPTEANAGGNLIYTKIYHFLVSNSHLFSY